MHIDENIVVAGKFAQRPNMTKVEYVQDPAKFLEYLVSGENIIKRVDSINKETVRLEYIKEDNFVEEQKNVNIVIAAFTTSYGRLELYKYLEKLGERLLYFDTGG